MHTTTHASHVETKEETKSKHLCCAYHVGVRASQDEIEEEEVQPVETKSLGHKLVVKDDHTARHAAQHPSVCWQHIRCSCRGR